MSGKTRSQHMVNTENCRQRIFSQTKCKIATVSDLLYISYFKLDHINIQSVTKLFLIDNQLNPPIMEGRRHLWLFLVSLCRRKPPLSLTYRRVSIKSVTPATQGNQLDELLQRSSLSKRVRVSQNNYIKETRNGLLIQVLF